MTELPLDRLARRACADPSFLGRQLAAFARARGFDDGALAAHLGCPVATLTQLRLCGAIRPERFREDVTAVADTFGLPAARLAEAAKPLPADPARDAATCDAPGALLAARDRAQAP
jgi:hypothetical protein